MSDRSVATRWGAAATLLGVAVLVVVLIVGGGAPQPAPAGIPDPGPITGWGLPIVRLIVDLAGLSVLGLLLAPALLLPSSTDVLSRPGYAAARLARWIALVWAVAVAVELVLTVSDILGLTPTQALDATILRSFVFQVPDGRVLGAQVLIAVLVFAVARSAIQSRQALLGAVLALVGVALPGLTGHSSANGNHDLASASLLVHIAAASLWTGGLVALTWLALRPGDDPSGWSLGLTRFSVLAGVCWVTVGVSGVVNAGVRLGGPGSMVGEAFGSSYGRLVLAKLTALLVLGGLGWWHRRHSVMQVTQAQRAAEGRPTLLYLRVAGVELLVMAATFGLAVGLSRTPTPLENVLPDTGAAAVLGFALPPAPSAYRMLTGWTPDGFALTFLLFAGIGYAAGVRTLRRRGDSWPIGRVVAWYLGLVFVAWATVGGLGLYSHVLFSAHMVAHMVLSMIAPIGLVLGAPITLALRALPGRRTPKELGLRQLLQRILDSRVVAVLSHPLVASALFVGSLYGLYFTPLFGELMADHLGHVVMEAHFVTVGCLFFWVLVGVDPTPRRLPPLARLGLLLVVMPFHAFFAIALMNTDTVLARSYFASLHRPYATDLLADQRYGGGLSWALGEVPILLVAAAVFVQWIRSDARDARRSDRAADRASSTATESELDRYNARLAALAEHRRRAEK